MSIFWIFLFKFIKEFYRVDQILPRPSVGIQKSLDFSSIDNRTSWV